MGHAASSTKNACRESVLVPYKQPYFFLMFTDPLACAKDLTKGTAAEGGIGKTTISNLDGGTAEGHDNYGCCCTCPMVFSEKEKCECLEKFIPAT